MLETLDYTIRIGSTPTILYFDLYLYSAYTAHYVYFKEIFYLPLNFPLADHMHAENLEDKGWISLLHEQWGKYEVYIPSENKRIQGDHGIIVL